MAMTMTQKILAAHAGLPQVKAGDLIEAKLDLVLGNDITTPVAITAFDRAGFTRVFDREKIAIVLDHSTPCKDIKSAQLCAKCREFARLSGGSITLSEDTDAVAGADVVYTDVWVSMGEPVEVWEERINALAPYQVNAQLMAKAKGTAVFMHCLPAYHDHKTAVGREMGEKFDRDAMEVTDDVFNGPQSIVFQEAENRMHTIKAVMAATLGA